MEYILTPEEMRRADSNTQEKLGVAGLILMERAALSCVFTLNREEFDLTNVLIVCGCGNNGGDGFAIGRMLWGKKVPVTIVFIGDESHCTEDTRKQMSICKNCGIEILDKIPSNEYTTIVDALIGISLNREIESDYAEAVNEINSRKARVLAVDIPTGIDACSGKVLGCAVKADVTVTFAYKKIGQLLYPGADYCGKIVKSDIGIYDFVFEDNLPKICAYEAEDICLPKREAYSNKGTFGKVLLIAGNVNMCGAAIFAGKAAFQTGCGMVKIYSVEENRTILQTSLPEAILSTYDKDQFEQEELQKSLDWCDCIGIGPGLTTSEVSEQIVRFVLERATAPLVCDADALNIISKNPDLLSSCSQEVIITPHVGEMSRLTGLSIDEIKNHLIDSATDFASSYNITCVLKDARTVIADENGNVTINTTGNSGMATAGSGDVLSGIICGLLAQGLKPFEASSLACAIHGSAGDRGKAKVGEHELMAHDIIDHLND